MFKINIFFGNTEYIYLPLQRVEKAFVWMF